jgi:hypothetical protein
VGGPSDFIFAPQYVIVVGLHLNGIPCIYTDDLRISGMLRKQKYVFEGNRQTQSQDQLITKACIYMRSGNSIESQLHELLRARE